MKRHWIRRMRRVGPARLGIDHLFCITVVRGNQRSPARLSYPLGNSAQTGIDILTSFDGFIQLTCVTNHVRIREIHDEDVSLPFLYCSQDFIGHLERGHFGLQIVSGNFGRRHQQPPLKLVLPLHAAGEKLGDVGVFLGFS
jgi:hypothetical protein